MNLKTRTILNHNIIHLLKKKKISTQRNEYSSIRISNVRS